MAIFIIEPMDEASAHTIFSWTYERPYDLYNMEFSDQLLAELLGGSYSTVRDGDPIIVGFCCFGESARVPFDGYRKDDGVIDIGLGMRPDLTGRGQGYAFVSEIVEFSKRRFTPSTLRLTVATFNRRAYTVYAHLGFEPTVEFIQKGISFTVMERRA